MCKNYVCRKASVSHEAKNRYRVGSFLLLFAFAAGMSVVGYLVGLQIIDEQKAAIMAAIIFPIITVAAGVSYMVDINTNQEYETCFHREKIKAGVTKWLNDQKVKTPAEKDDEFFESVKRFCIAVNNINNKPPKSEIINLSRFDFSKN